MVQVTLMTPAQWQPFTQKAERSTVHIAEHTQAILISRPRTSPPHRTAVLRPLVSRVGRGGVSRPRGPSNAYPHTLSGGAQPEVQS
ncbi:hypothetical protein AAFF_G00201020 [Aldrovandia affinis]|uniref:Uncharacterized protein n=1 Tax=Aldrovandia affinis TaxID=143900 RepID=A0AAD7W6F3_9TELE|nr:hypothetical protein AAFF_G00201020 [Aldrovandia affinis]